MTPTPRRHRASRRRRVRKRRRGLFGPIASATVVLVAMGPVVWLMATGTHPTVDTAAKVLNDSTESNNTPDLSTPELGPAPGSTTPAPAPSVTTVTVTVTRPTRGTTRTPAPSRRTASRVSSSGTSAEEREVLDLTNQLRVKQGCGRLRLDSTLVEAAGKQAADMVRRHYMDHTNPDGADPGDRMTAAGYRGPGWGENIAAGYRTAEKVVAAWMQSAGHRKNILNCRFTTIGIGYDPGEVKSGWGPGSWVQDFGRS